MTEKKKPGRSPGPAKVKRLVSITETANEELELYAKSLGFRSGTAWMSDQIEKKFAKPVKP